MCKNARETESHKPGMRPTSPSESNISPKDTNAQLTIVATDLAWAYHTNEDALLGYSLDHTMKLTNVTFLDSEVATKRSCR